MEKQLNNTYIQMSTEQLNNLTSVVKEKLATCISQPKTKVFAAVDLWSIQRQGKNRIQRRISF